MPDAVQLRLVDAVDIKHGFAFSGKYFSAVGPGDRVVTPGNFRVGGGWQDGKPKYYQGPPVAGFTLCEGDLVVTMTDLSKAGDTLGLSAQIPGGGPFLHNQRIGLVRVTDPTRLDAVYLYYLLQSPGYRRHVLATATGSTVRHTSPSRILDFLCDVPPPGEQRAIAEVLGALDAKVEANRHIVPLLRDLAKATLQRSACSSTKSYRVHDVADVRKGLSYTGAGLADAGMPMVNLANAENFGWLKRSGFKHYTGVFKPRHIAQSGALLIAGVEQTWRHEIIGWPMLLPSDLGEALFSHHVFLVDFRAENSWLRLPLWAHLYAPDARARLEGMVYGTTVATLPAEALTGLEFPAPSRDDPAIDAADALLHRAWAAEEENTTLLAMRDALLPALMSGELRVREVGSLVGDAV